MVVFKHVYPSYKDIDMGYPYVDNWKKPKFSKVSAEVVETTIEWRSIPRLPA